MATCKRTPLSPTAMEAAAMTAGPVRNLTAIAKAAVELPHAMILGCNAMNNPAHHHTHKKKTQLSQLTSHYSLEKTFHQISDNSNYTEKKKKHTTVIRTEHMT